VIVRPRRRRAGARPSRRPSPHPTAMRPASRSVERHRPPAPSSPSPQHVSLRPTGDRGRAPRPGRLRRAPAAKRASPSMRYGPRRFAKPVRAKGRTALITARRQPRPARGRKGPGAVGRLTRERPRRAGRHGAALHPPPPSPILPACFISFVSAKSGVLRNQPAEIAPRGGDAPGEGWTTV